MILLMVHPKDPDESRRIQEAAFAAGYTWSVGSQYPQELASYWITFRPERKILRHSGNIDFISKPDFTEMTVPEILRMLGARQDIDCTVPEDS